MARSITQRCDGRCYGRDVVPGRTFDAARFARLALAGVEREYPNKLDHVMSGPHDVGTPRTLHPAFFGCFDWHSAVHGHWLLVRLLVTSSERGGWAEAAEAALSRNLTAESLAGELAYLDRADRVGFERPYGLAWLLRLGAELRRWDHGASAGIVAAMAPLEQLAAARLVAWVSALGQPVRSGEHSCSAFAMALALDWARDVGEDAVAAVMERRAIELHGADRGGLEGEPSGQDFLSPTLAAADLMRRVLAPDEFSIWLGQTVAIPPDGGVFLQPAVPHDRRDGKLVHQDGCNLSRAWMLEGIAAALASGDPRRAALLATAEVHAEAGLGAIDDGAYEGSHWLGTFAVMLRTRAGDA